MPLHVLDNKIWFPPLTDALTDGLLAIGGDLTVERLILAYRRGIFPWFDGDIPMWWSPDPRFVLEPAELKISKSMKTLLNKNAFKFTINKAFPQVIKACKEKVRTDQDGTWITDEVEKSYNTLFDLKYAQSAEAWYNNQLVGGLYGIRMGNLFFGESMFSHQSNASKYAFIKYVDHLQQQGVVLIDCQVYTEHLESLGAKMISRSTFVDYLKDL